MSNEQLYIDAEQIHEKLVGNPNYLCVGIASDKLIIYTKTSKKIDLSFISSIKSAVSISKMGKVVPVSDVVQEEKAAAEYRCIKCNSILNASIIQETIAYIKEKGKKSSSDPVVAQCSCGHVQTASEFEDLSHIPISHSKS